MVNRTSTFVAAGCVFFAVSLAPAQSGSAGDINSLNRGAGAGVVPRLVKFSGEINAQTIENSWSGKGANQAAAAISLTFSLYELQEGGSPLWWESQKVQLDDQGRYTVLLGANQSDGLPLDLFTSSRALWLGVQPQLPGAVEEPRVLLVAVPYALKASDADTLGGKPASAYALAGPALAAVVPGGSPPGSANQEPASDSRLATPDSRLLTPASQPQPAAACSAVTSDGTASANYLAKFTSACNIQRSLLFDNGTKVGVGTSAPVAFLDAQSTLTATSAGFNYGLRTLTTANPAAASSASFFSLFANAQTQAGNAQNFYNLYGMDFRTDHYGTGTVNGAYGGFGAVLNDAGGTINNAYGLYTYLSNGSTGKIGNAYGLYLAAPLNGGGGTFSNYTGVYIANPTAVVPNAFAVYSAGGTNYFKGNVGIGTTTPTAPLEVNGAAKFDSTLTVTGLTAGKCLQAGTGGVLTTTASPCGSGSGGGTITGVTAGTDLTGGGTTGNVSLGLDTTKVPTLAAASNVFAGSISATSFSGDGTNVTNVNAAKLGGLLPAAFQPAGSYAVTTGPNTFAGAQTISTGDVTLSGGNLDLPVTNGTGTAGVITLGGAAFADAVGLDNTFIGTLAGNFSTTGYSNTATGHSALHANTTGYANTASGSSALFSNTTGHDNTAAGFNSLLLTTGNQNTATGSQALDGNTTGDNNTATGYMALYANTTAIDNTATGTYALQNNLDSIGNTGDGYFALQMNCYAVSSGCTASYNTALGYFAGVTANGASGNITGANNTFVGALSGPGTATNLNNATAIGANALVSESNALVLGGTGANAVKVGVGTATPAYTLDVQGTGNFAGAVNFGQPVTFSSGQTFPGTGPGTVTSVGSGAGLTGGPISGSGTLSIATGGVTNAMLQKSSLTVTAGSGLSGGGSVSLGGSTALSLNPNISGTTGTFSGSASPVVSVTNTANSSGGVLGTSLTIGYTAYPTGVWGSGAVGVAGSATATAGYGVYGSSTGNKGTGVLGGGGMYGVVGSSANGTGVYGSGSLYGVEGMMSYTNGVSGVLGWSTGEADGVLGQSDGDMGIGVHGNGGFEGVYGESAGFGVGGTGAIGVEGVENDGGTFGVYSMGDFGASGNKSAVVALPDNRVVELYAMESPEDWFEDFGSGELRDGVGEVAFDSTFALAANMAPGYHVFLTPNGDCKGLYVDQKTASGFRVRELQGGKSNIAFDYRIVAKRRGYESVRMEELDADAETVQAIREFVQRPRHRKKLVLHRRVQVRQTSGEPLKVETPPTPAFVPPAPVPVAPVALPRK